MIRTNGVAPSYTLFWEACLRNPGAKALVRLLFDSGADPRWQNEAGEDMLTWIKRQSNQSAGMALWLDFLGKSGSKENKTHSMMQKETKRKKKGVISL